MRHLITSALGNLMANYESDLNFIRNFQSFMIDKNTEHRYLKDDSSGFYRFTVNYRVARCYTEGKSDRLLQLSKRWILNEDETNVDGFAIHLKNEGLTHKKLPVSLASKILFLNNPVDVLPYDKWARSSSDIRTNSYKDFLKGAGNFKMKHSTLIQNAINSIDTHLSLIENDFQSDIKNLKAIRESRFLDKIMWTNRPGIEILQ